MPDITQKKREQIAQMWNARGKGLISHMELEIEEVSTEGVKVRMPFNPDFCADRDQTLLHGGILTALLDSDSEITNSRFPESDCVDCAEGESEWVQSLYRNGVHLVSAPGSITRIRMICDQNWWDYPLSEDMTLASPKDPQTCKLHVRGRKDRPVTISEIWLR